MIPIIITHGEWRGAKDSLIQPSFKNNETPVSKLSSVLPRQSMNDTMSGFTSFAEKVAQQKPNPRRMQTPLK